MDWGNTAEDSLFSATSLRFSVLQFSLLPRIFQYFLKIIKTWKKLAVSKNRDASHTGRLQLSVILTGPAQHLMKHLNTVNYSEIEGSSWNMWELELPGHSPEHSKRRLTPLKEKERSPYSNMPFPFNQRKWAGHFSPLTSTILRNQACETSLHSRVHITFPTRQDTYMQAEVRNSCKAGSI